MQAAVNKLGDAARTDASRQDDPHKKEHILDNIAAVEKALPVDLAANNELMNNPKDNEKKEKAQKTTDDIINAIDKLDPYSTTGPANEAKKLLDEMVKAAKAGDQKKVDEVGEKIVFFLT